MYSTKIELSCQLWTLSDNDVSIQVPQCSTNTTLVEEADGAWLCMCGDVAGLVYGNPLYFLLSFAMNLNCSKNKLFPDFPGGPVVGSPPANAVDRGSIPVAGRVHMLKGS